MVKYFGCASVLLSALGVSCGDSEEHVVSNQGWLCVGKGPSQTNEACPAFSLEQQLALHVNFGLCLSGSCSRPGQTSCRASRSGSIIEVTAEGTWSDTGEESCTLDCRALTATCQTESLPDGDYEIRYANKTLAVTIPSSRSRHCMPGRGFAFCCDTDADCAGVGTCDTLTHTCRNMSRAE